MAAAGQPFNLRQFHDGLLAAFPDRTVPEGWGLRASGAEVEDPFGVFTDAEIAGVIAGTVFDEDHGRDPDLLFLRDQAEWALADAKAAASNANVDTSPGRGSLKQAVLDLIVVMEAIVRRMN